MDVVNGILIVRILLWPFKAFYKLCKRFGLHYLCLALFSYLFQFSSSTYVFIWIVCITATIYHFYAFFYEKKTGEKFSLIARLNKNNNAGSNNDTDEAISIKPKKATAVNTKNISDIKILPCPSCGNALVLSKNKEYYLCYDCRKKFVRKKKANA